MELHSVEIQARKLLASALRFSHPMDKWSITDLAYENDQSWRSDSAALRLNARAFDLLFGGGFVAYGDSPSQIVVSASGQQVLASGQPLSINAEWIAQWIEEEDLREAFDAAPKISANTFSSLALHDWRQFRSVSVGFHSRLTVITGANASGKTTILNALAPHFNWQSQLVAGPDGKQGPTSRAVGRIAYTSGATTEIVATQAPNVRNAPLGLNHMQPVPGLFISSHRSISAYQPLDALPPRFSESETLLGQFNAEVQARYLGGNSQVPPLHRMKESLYAAAMYAYGSKALEPDPAAQDVWEGFQVILRNFLPTSLRFQELKAARGELNIVSATALFPIEAVSGGISAMLELAWQIFLRSRNQESFTVCIDEPENHLHPELQRTILPSLLRAFPDVSFIVATHSPFVVTSEQTALVYALHYDEDGQVSSHQIDTVNFAGTADETLLSVLGLDTALPIWAESRLESLLAALPVDPTAGDLRRLRDNLRAIGLGRQFPASVEAIGRGSQT